MNDNNIAAKGEGVVGRVGNFDRFLRKSCASEIDALKLARNLVFSAASFCVFNASSFTAILFFFFFFFFFFFSSQNLNCVSIATDVVSVGGGGDGGGASTTTTGTSGGGGRGEASIISASGGGGDGITGPGGGDEITTGPAHSSGVDAIAKSVPHRNGPTNRIVSIFDAPK